MPVWRTPSTAKVSAWGQICLLCQTIADTRQTASAADLKAAGKTGGGKVNLGPLTAAQQQVENWWTGAGGPGGTTARIAQAITGAESGYDVTVVQAGQAYATTGWGLWQITPGDSEPQVAVNQGLLNGPANARAAVAKYNSAGGFSPWTTYNDGAYEAFMDQGGYLPPGTTVVHNNTGQPERVIPPGGGGHMIVNNFYGVAFPSPEQVQAMNIATAAAVAISG